MKPLPLAGLALVAACMSLGACSSAPRAGSFEWAAERDSIEAWERYLEEHPEVEADDPDARERRVRAQSRFDELTRPDEEAWARATRGDGVMSYRVYLEQFEKGVHASEARERLSDRLEDLVVALVGGSGEEVVRVDQWVPPASFTEADLLAAVGNAQRITYRSTMNGLVHGTQSIALFMTSWTGSADSSRSAERIVLLPDPVGQNLSLRFRAEYDRGELVAAPAPVLSGDGAILLAAPEGIRVVALGDFLDSSRPVPDPATATRPVMDWALAQDETMIARTWIAAHPSADLSGTVIAAARGGRCEMLALLLDAGADPAEVDAEGRSALDEAARYAHTECVATLVARGLDPALRARALVWNRIGKLEYLTERVAREGLPEGATADPGRAAPRVVAPHDAVVPYLLVPGETPLMLAATTEDSELLEALVRSATIDVNARDEQGRTALTYAISAGRQANAEILRRAGAVE